MAIEEIISIVDPPAAPIETGDSEDWKMIQELLGISLPDDLFQIGRRYGTGRFSDSSIDIIVFNPFASTYSDTIKAECEILRDFKDMRDEDEVPYVVYPDPNGLFPWGTDSNGNVMFLLTGGAIPNEWPIVLQTRDGEFQQLEFSITRFLAKSFKREIKCILWQQEGFFPDPDGIAFIPL